MLVWCLCYQNPLLKCSRRGRARKLGDRSKEALGHGSRGIVRSLSSRGTVVRFVKLNLHWSPKLTSTNPFVWRGNAMHYSATSPTVSAMVNVRRHRDLHSCKLNTNLRFQFDIELCTGGVIRQ